ncbi:hypothetical protein [Herpetosiphon geysericola]|uniref:Uncharacterized protein n=1 Tax=Herpetosiphon geysericola TaxID=70996 RepID=A0A0P6Y8Q6_9CHLR|nr:hypothetical protein [Herpetosiphon geysericola]KPL85437.1 hypothetical protein SE18_17530 [Herpetosiphon geysericola]
MSTNCVAVTTHLLGLGNELRTPPSLISLPQGQISARQLLQEHVHNELSQSHQTDLPSLALNYLIAKPSHNSMIAAEQVRSQAEAAFRAGDCWLMLDGIAVHNLDTPLQLQPQSRVGFMRLYQR